ncbi:MAG: leucine-rich repeat domain-containing protein [Bacteroidales bacterium]|nr:leucine-rich repeat domain-containing protein [Bacteroidales bacterium]
MKKLVFASLIIASACLIVFSCKNGGENNQSDNSEKAQPEEEAFVLPQVDDVCSQMDDPSFIALCKKNFDTNQDGKVSMEEAGAVTELVFDSPLASEESESRWEYDEPLKSLKGLEYFPNLEILVLEYHQVTSLDISHNTMLKQLYCSSNKIGTLDVSKNTHLKELICSSCGLTALDVTKNTELYNLQCSDNQIPSLDVTNCTRLTDLAFSTNQIASIDVSKCTGLNNLYCVNNQLTSLDVSSLPELVTLNCEGNQLTSLDVSKNPKLEWLLCNRNKLTKVDLTNNPKISLAMADEGVELIGYKK